MNLNVNETLVAKELVVLGKYEPKLTKLFVDIIKKGDIVLDIGANVGYFSIVASYLTGVKGTVLSFEPVKSVFHSLEDNIKLNNIKNVNLFNVGLGSREAKMPIFIDEKNSGSNSLVKDNRNEGKQEFVEIKKLDDILTDFNVHKINLIKIDIEGFEFEALKGMTRLLNSNRNIKIILEFSPIIYDSFGKNYTRKFIDFIYENKFIVKNAENNKIINLYKYDDVAQLNILLERSQ